MICGEGTGDGEPGHLGGRGFATLSTDLNSRPLVVSGGKCVLACLDCLGCFPTTTCIRNAIDFLFFTGKA
jgi:hypothetical protein